MLRSPDNRHEVAWVPHYQLREALFTFKEFIYQGTEVDPNIKLGKLINELFDNETRLGIFYEIDPFEPMGSWFSDLRIDSVTHKKYATIFGLAGKHPNKWALGVWELVSLWAKKENCYSVRCQGRLGWLKYQNGVILLRTINKREGLLEKVIEK